MTQNKFFQKYRYSKVSVLFLLLTFTDFDDFLVPDFIKIIFKNPDYICNKICLCENEFFAKDSKKVTQSTSEMICVSRFFNSLRRTGQNGWPFSDLWLRTFYRIFRWTLISHRHILCICNSCFWRWNRFHKIGNLVNHKVWNKLK